MKYDPSGERRPEGEIHFEDIYKTYFNYMFCIAVSILRDRALAEDAVQNAFLKILGSVYMEETFHSPDILKRLTVITRSCSIDLLRKKIKKQEMPVSNIYDFEMFKADHLYGRHQTKPDELLEKIEKLPEKTRDVFLLRFIRGYSNKETAKILKIPECTVRKRIQRGRKLLKREMEKYD